MQLLYATFASKDDALAAARALVEEQLAACANVVDGAVSVYRWEGRVREQPEAMLFAKTAQGKKAVARLKALHAYELPCILLLPVEGGFAPFMAWVEDATPSS